MEMRGTREDVLPSLFWVSGISAGGGGLVIPNIVRNLAGGERDLSLRSG